jgi:hypothetical protein
MVSMNVYDAKISVWVTPYTGATMKYGFLTNVLASVRTDCGHNIVGDTTPTALVYGANAPKPGRASKRTATANQGSYYSIGQVSTLRADGYSLTRPTIRRGGAGASSTAVYVTMNGIKYAWRIPTRLLNRISADASGLGIQIATSSDRDLVWGSKPRPPRAYRTSGLDILSTYVDPSRIDSLPEGWSTSAREQVD